MAAIKNLTPPHLRCQIGYCPSVHELEDGRLLIVGKYATQRELNACGARCDIQEFGVIIDRALLANVNNDELESLRLSLKEAEASRAEIIEECAKVADAYAKDHWGFTEEEHAAEKIAEFIRVLKSKA